MTSHELAYMTRFLVPIGGIIPWAGIDIPDGFLECDGSAISRTGYVGLFGVIGTTWGPGDGSITFNLPNLMGGI